MKPTIHKILVMFLDWLQMLLGYVPIWHLTFMLYNIAYINLKWHTCNNLIKIDLYDVAICHFKLICLNNYSHIKQ